MTLELTEGAVSRILNGERVEKPILQILGSKQVGTANKYRMLVSDGVKCHPYSMLGSQLIERLMNKEFEKFTVVRMNNYICNTINAERTIMVLLDMTVIATGEEVGQKLGAPSTTNDEMKSDDVKTEVKTEPARETGSYEQNANSTSSRAAVVNNIVNTVNNGFRGPRPDGPGGMTTTQTANVYPISSLSPYQNKWTIKVRVTSKQSIRHWSNSKGEGKLFSFDVCDESGEMRCTAFKDECDKFYEMINVNDLYYISKAQLKMANKKYSNLKCDYELTFNSETTVLPCNEGPSSIPMQVYDFKSIEELQNIEPDSIVDVIGVCKSYGEVQNLTSRSTGKEFRKRDIILVDKTNMEISATLWAESADTFDGSTMPILAIKGCKLSDYAGRSLSLMNSSSLVFNPDIREAHVLRGWYDQEGMHAQATSITQKTGPTGGSNWKTFAQAKAEQLGKGDKPDYYSCKATVIMVKKDNCMYMACPGEGCQKKVTDMHNGRYRCDKCDKEFNEFKWRLLLSLSIADFSDNIWVTSFQDNGEIMLEMKAQDLGELKDVDEEQFGNAIGSLNFKAFTFKLRAKMETFNEENRLKTIVANAAPLNFKEYGKKLLKDIKEMEAHLK